MPFYIEIKELNLPPLFIWWGLRISCRQAENFRFEYSVPAGTSRAPEKREVLSIMSVDCTIIVKNIIFRRDRAFFPQMEIPVAKFLSVWFLLQSDYPVP